jgi:hypothetical protein
MVGEIRSNRERYDVIEKYDVTERHNVIDGHFEFERYLV